MYKGNAIKTLIIRKTLEYGHLFGSAIYLISMHKSFNNDECLAALKIVEEEIDPHSKAADKLGSRLHNGKAYMGFRRLI